MKRIMFCLTLVACVAMLTACGHRRGHDDYSSYPPSGTTPTLPPGGVIPATPPGGTGPALPPVFPPITPAYTEDLLSINPAHCHVVLQGGMWKITEGPVAVMSFGTNKPKAEATLAVLQHYHVTHLGYAVRPNPAMTYMLVSGHAPTGAMAGEDAIAFDWHHIDAQLIGGHWLVTCGPMSLLNFGSDEAAARKAKWIIQQHQFTHQCFVGRGGLAPSPAFAYFRR